MKILVYSAIDGEYDTPAKVGSMAGGGVRFLMYANSNNIAQSADRNGWEVRRLETRQRLIKADPWRYIAEAEEADIILWIDGSIQPRPNFLQFVRRASAGFQTTIHRDRSDIAEEAKAIIRLGKDTPERVEKALSIAPGLAKNRLFETAIILRLGQDATAKSISSVWHGLLSIPGVSHRDQLTLPIVDYLTGRCIAAVPHTEVYSFFTLRPHKKNEHLLL